LKDLIIDDLGLKPDLDPSFIRHLKVTAIGLAAARLLLDNNPYLVIAIQK
jgi:hypothetical protein